MILDAKFKNTNFLQITYIYLTKREAASNTLDLQ